MKKNKAKEERARVEDERAKVAEAIKKVEEANLRKVARRKERRRLRPRSSNQWKSGKSL